MMRNIFGKKPFVLMLEPTGRCNLSCEGCGRVEELGGMEMSVEECLLSADECGAPVVAITGGEPLLHPRIGEIVEGLLRRKKFVYLCTNGLLLKKFLEKMKPSPYLSFSLHLDGMEETHDRLCGRKGVFREALSAIRMAKERGFKVCVNTTVYRETDPEEVENLFSLLSGLVDGFLLSPAYPFRDKDIYPDIKEMEEKFRRLSLLSRKFNFLTTPLYMDFVKGEKSLPCSPWGNPTRNAKGWKSPCYFITDAYYDSFKELMEKTPWDKYGPGRDERCSSCRTHYGFEPSAIMRIMRSPREAVRTFIWSLR